MPDRKTPPAFDKLHSLAPSVIPAISPRPGSLAAQAFPADRAPFGSDARIALSVLPRVVDLVVWYEQQEALSYSLLHLAVKAAGQPIGNIKTAQDVDRAHAALLEHSRQIAGNHLPLLLAKDGVHTIPYERLAEARAKVQVLLAENAELRAKLAANARGQRP